MERVAAGLNVTARNSSESGAVFTSEEDMLNTVKEEDSFFAGGIFKYI